MTASPSIQDTLSLHLVCAATSLVTIPLPQNMGLIQAMVFPTGPVAVHEADRQLQPDGAAPVSPARQPVTLREAERLGARVMAHLVWEAGEAGRIRQLHRRLMCLQEPAECCMGREVDTLADPVIPEVWTDPDWPGLLGSHRAGLS